MVILVGMLVFSCVVLCLLILFLNMIFFIFVNWIIFVVVWFDLVEMIGFLILILIFKIVLLIGVYRVEESLVCLIEVLLLWINFRFWCFCCILVCLVLMLVFVWM